MICKQFLDLNDVQEAEWNSLLTAKDYLHSYRFLQSIHTAKVENAAMFFLMIYDDERLIGTAVLSDFVINLDLFIQSESLADFIKKIIPKFFRTRILFAGLPLSSGQKNIYALQGFEKEVAQIVYEQMEQIAQARKIKTLVVKEFSDFEMQLWQSFQDFGFIAAHSLPTATMLLPYKNYNEYLSSLKSNYRRQIKQSLAKMQMSEPIIEQGFEPQKTETHFAILSTKDLSVATFFEWYKQVMQRSQTKLEMLNSAFFEQLWQNQNDELKLLAVIENEIIKAVSIFVVQENEINFLWSGKDFEKDSIDSYPNLLNALVAYGIENNCQKIILGQTSYYPKMKIGGQLEARSFYIKSRNKWIQKLFRKYNEWIFPKSEEKQLLVFKNQNE